MVRLCRCIRSAIMRETSLTMRLDAAGAVIGLTADETITSTTVGTVSLVKETLKAQAGNVTVRRGVCGERWQIPAH